MKVFPISYILLLFAALMAPAHSQTPATRRSPAHYSKMCENSPFTIAPKAANGGAEAETPLSAWTLSGFGQIGDKMIVILQNKKTAGERITIISGEKNDKNIEIMEIQRGKSYMQDRVRLRLAGSVEGWVSYEPQFLKLAPPPAAPAQKNQQQK